MSRIEVRNELTPALRRAVALGKTPGAHSRESGARRAQSTSIPVASTTRAGVGDGGEIITVFDFMLGVDTLGDKHARLRVKGNPKNYGS